MVRAGVTGQDLRGHGDHAGRGKEVVEAEPGIRQAPSAQRPAGYGKPGVPALPGMQGPPHVRQPKGDEGGERLALSVSMVRGASIERGMVTVQVRGGDVQVATYHHGLAGRQEAPDEGEEYRFEAMTVRLPVRTVQERRTIGRHYPHGGELEREDATFGVYLGDAGGQDAERGFLAQDSDAMVTATFSAQPRSVIPAYHVGQGLATELRLLEAQDVGPLAQQCLQAPVLHAGGTTVHVPGDDPHAGKGSALPVNKQIQDVKELDRPDALRAGPSVWQSAYPLPYGTLFGERDRFTYSNRGTLQKQ